MNHISKLFKIACLAYTPSTISYRDFNLTHAHQITLRKFLIGQSHQIIMSSPLMKDLQLSTRRVFDDLYLFVRNKSHEIEKAGENSEFLQYLAET